MEIQVRLKLGGVLVECRVICNDPQALKLAKALNPEEFIPNWDWASGIATCTQFLGPQDPATRLTDILARAMAEMKLQETMIAQAEQILAWLSANFVRKDGEPT